MIKNKLNHIKMCRMYLTDLILDIKKDIMDWCHRVIILSPLKGNFSNESKSCKTK